MWGCQVLKALVILLWNHKHCSITVPIGTFCISAQNTILKAQSACITFSKMLVQSIISIKCEVAKFKKHEWYYCETTSTVLLLYLSELYSFLLKIQFKKLKMLAILFGGACAIDNPNQMWGCQVLKALVILLWNHKHCSITVPIRTSQFSAQNTILKAQNAHNIMIKKPVESIIPIKCEVAKF